MIPPSVSYSFTFQNEDVKGKALKVLETKCNVCHRSSNPRRVFTAVNVDKLAPKIQKQVFVKRRMPKGDDIKLTLAEEQILRRWLDSGVLKNVRDNDEIE